MNTIKFIIIVSMVLLCTDLIYPQVANGQWWNSTNSTNNNPQTEATIGNYGLKGCLITETQTLVILDLNRLGCGDPIGSIEHFSSLGYQIKAVESLSGDRTQHLMYMQK